MSDIHRVPWCLHSFFCLVVLLASFSTPCRADTTMVVVYSESSWSILSVNCLFIAVMCVFLLDLRSTAVVPFIVSVAGGIANGLCFYAYYQTAQYSTDQILAAAGVADVMWGIQEIGLSFYSFFILRRTLAHTATMYDKVLYYSLFAFFCVGAVVVRGTILVYRQLQLRNGTLDQTTINDLHISYFTLIACLECTNAWFLIKSFARALTHTTNSRRLFKKIVQSSEVRLALLFAIGLCRAVTYSYQTKPQAADSAATQLDRFVYAAECFFPVVFIVDRLATRKAANASKPNGSGATPSEEHSSRSDRQENTASSPAPRGRQTVVATTSVGMTSLANSQNGGTSTGGLPRKESAKQLNQLRITNSTIGASSLIYSFPPATNRNSNINNNVKCLSPTTSASTPNPETTATASPSTKTKMHMTINLNANSSSAATDHDGSTASVAIVPPPLDTISLQ